MTDRPDIPDDHDHDPDEPAESRDDAAAAPGLGEPAEPRQGEPADGPSLTAGDPPPDEPEAAGRHDPRDAREPLGGAPRDPLRDDPERPVFSFAAPDPAPRRLTRSSSDRMIGGVAGGLGRYFDVDPLLFRIGFVVLTFAGGFGLLAYVLGAVAIPDEDEHRPQRWGLWRTLGAGLLAAAALAVITPHWLWGPELPGLVACAVVLYLLLRVIRDPGAAPHPSHAAARIALGILLFALATAGFAGAAAGTALGGGILIAGTVIALGVALVGGAFRGGARWLIVPAFVLALPLGVVSAADLEVKGPWGDRTYRPATAADL